MNQIVIIGSGPAGYTAAIYAGRAGLEPIVIEGPQVGGQLMTTTEVENFPGYPEGVDPFTMMTDLRKQAERFGTRYLCGRVISLTSTDEGHTLTLDDDSTLTAKAVIVATGASAKYLGIESEQTYKGKGVSACATCDGFFYRRKIVAVVGGGDTACEEANYLAGLCQKVYLIVRKPYLRASQIMQDRVLNNPKIEVLFEHNTLRLTGADRVEGADLIYRMGTNEEQIHHIDISGFFLAIGHHPNTGFLTTVEKDEEGYIRVDEHQRTNIPGLFAAGDCADPTYRQAIVAAGSGAKAAMEAIAYVK